MGQNTYGSNFIMYVDVHYICKKSYYSHNVVIAGYQVILFFMFLENTILLIYLFLAEAHRSMPPAVEAQRVNHWTTRKVLKLFLFSSLSLKLFLFSSLSLSSNSLSLCIIFSQLFYFEVFQAFRKLQEYYNEPFSLNFLSLLNQIENHTMLYPKCYRTNLLKTRTFSYTNTIPL